MRSRKIIASLFCASGVFGAAQAFGQGQPVQINDALYGLNRNNPTETLQHLRSDPPNSATAVKLGTAWNAGSIQSVQFDNYDGFRHAWDGNAMGMDFGSVANGARIFTLQTRIAPAAANPQATSALFDFPTYNTANPGAPLTVGRGAGLSVSPANNRITFTGVDGTLNGLIYVLDYNAGATPGTGAGASVTNGRQLTGVVQSGSASNTTATAWLDNDNILTLQHPTNGAGSPNATLKKVTIAANGSLSSTDVGTVALGAGTAAFSSLSYEPNVSPYVYLTTSQFSGSTINHLNILDPNNNFASVGSFDYSTSMNTARENAFDAKGNLYIGEFGNTTSTPLGGSIDRITKANIQANLANNNSAKWYIQDQAAALSAQFSGLDVAGAFLDYTTPGVTVNMRTKSVAVPYFPGTVNDPTAAIRARLLTGRNGGTWDGTGSAIVSSDAAAGTPRNRGIGYVQNTDILPGGVGTWGGLTLVAGDSAVLMKYTWYGDTDLNGIVDFDDYSRIDSGFNNNRTGWFNGDVDYNNIVDFDDYSLVDQAFNTQTGTLRRAMAYLDGSDRSDTGMDAPSLQLVMEHFGQFGEQYAAGFLASVPEPASLGALGLIAGVTLVRRRRR
ncbi:MAG: PEP-CTERM sorting domain-containing protein [Anaerolineae bacterium]|nr:PEP-CTERM sorting domain-containing protein [Phycisphaerae bacterium]